MPITIMNKPLPKSNKTPNKLSAAPDQARDFPKAPAYFFAQKNVYARKGQLVVRLHKDGYFRRHKNLPILRCTPLGPTRVADSDRNEIRRGLFCKPVS